MDRSSQKTFSAVLEPLKAGPRWVAARLPFDIADAWPVRTRLRVRGHLEGFPIRTSLIAHGGDYFLLVNGKMQAAAKVGVGSKVMIELEPDLEDRKSEVPAELAKALAEDKRLRQWFDGLGTALRRDIGKWVIDPKSDGARRNRAGRAAEWLLLVMEGETELPPILKAGFQRRPDARGGWEAMSAAQRRRHLLGIFHLQTVEARQRRAEKAIEEAAELARKRTATAD